VGTARGRVTRGFEDTCAWLAVHTSRAAVAELLGVAWRTVGRVCARVAAEHATQIDLLDGLRRIGIDEISYKKGQRYLTVVVDHDSGRLVWAAPGANEATLERFFDALGEQRCARVELVSADAAEWIAGVVQRRCPAAVRCADPFHVIKWATDALDEVRREVWNVARKDGDTVLARELKGARFALWKNPEDLTRRQRGKLGRIAEINQRLYRAYLLKEELRLVFKLRGPRGVALLDAWLSWARRCRIPGFVRLARSVTAYRDTIVASLVHGASNARVESVNTKLRLLTRIAFGFKSPEALIGLAMLALGGLCPALPGRA
jgi:transposase